MDAPKPDRGVIPGYHSKRLELMWSNLKTKMEGINKAAQSLTLCVGRPTVTGKKCVLDLSICMLYEFSSRATDTS